jgi:porphobilinogen synthase
MENGLPIVHRPRRLRASSLLRGSLAGVRVLRRDIVLPVFVCDGSGVRREIGSMPGVFQMSLDVAADWLADRAKEGFAACLLFGVIEKSKKDERGSHALDPQNVVCRLLREMKHRKIPMVAITDLCFCEYTSHGHCGVLGRDGAGAQHDAGVQNDATVKLLVEQALNHARSGAEIIAPSGMMDGAVEALRRGLNAEGFTEVAILAYSVKYASAFYGPFREAADSAPQFGDRNAYQMDPARGIEEALREARLDVEQGADMVMVKPGLPYLDVLAAVRKAVDVPVVAYQVSGEYSMLESAARQGWLDRDGAVRESLIALKRAGASLIISYFWEAAVRLFQP